MVLLRSQALLLGTVCHDFSLMSVDGTKQYSLADFSSSQALLLAFICNHCPYVRAIEDRLIALGRNFEKADLQIVGICPNDASRYPEDAPFELSKRAREKNYGFPYLLDEKQDVARAFDAVCTPDFFLYDGDRKLFYHGRLDDNWQDASSVKRQFLQEAVVAILDGNEPPSEQEPSLGCSIKWRS